MIKINRILLLCFFLFSSAAFSQEKENPFNRSENEIFSNSQNQFAIADYEANNDSQNLNNGTGPPGDDDTVPIDHYILFLVVAAVAIIGYIGTKKQTIET